MNVESAGYPPPREGGSSPTAWGSWTNCLIRARVLFGPAARALPQLPISVDSEGYLIATSDYKVPVGPSFWERGATQQ